MFSALTDLKRLNSNDKWNRNSESQTGALVISGKVTFLEFKKKKRNKKRENHLKFALNELKWYSLQKTKNEVFLFFAWIKF